MPAKTEKNENENEKKNERNFRDAHNRPSRCKGCIRLLEKRRLQVRAGDYLYISYINLEKL